MSPVQQSGWRADWAWGLPLIVLTVMFHVGALGFLKRRFLDKVRPRLWGHQTLLVGAVTLYIALLHTFEVGFWAAMFVFLAAVPDAGSAVLYSLNAITSYGHTDLKLQKEWQLLGAMESLNGWILFGLSAAYLFVLIQEIWSVDGIQEPRSQKPCREPPRHFDAGAG